MSQEASIIFTKYYLYLLANKLTGNLEYIVHPPEQET
jgi:hypothetical protein